MEYQTPPDGWFTFGSHVGFDGPLEFSAETGEDGLPLWERHTPAGDDLRGRVVPEGIRVVKEAESLE